MIPFYSFDKVQMKKVPWRLESFEQYIRHKFFTVGSISQLEMEVEFLQKTLVYDREAYMINSMKYQWNLFRPVFKKKRMAKVLIF